MTGSTLELLGTEIDEVFFLIRAAILLTELIENRVKGSLRWRALGDIIANVSTQIPFLLIEILALTKYQYSLFLGEQCLDAAIGHALHHDRKSATTSCSIDLIEAVGNVNLKRAALEDCHKGRGERTVIGVAGDGQEIAKRVKLLAVGMG